MPAGLGRASLLGLAMPSGREQGIMTEDDVGTREFKLLDLIGDLKDEDNLQKKISQLGSYLSLFEREFKESEVLEIFNFAGIMNDDLKRRLINVLAGSELITIRQENLGYFDPNSSEYLFVNSSSQMRQASEQMRAGAKDLLSKKGYIK